MKVSLGFSTAILSLCMGIANTFSQGLIANSRAIRPVNSCGLSMKINTEWSSNIKNISKGIKTAIVAAAIASTSLDTLVYAAPAGPPVTIGFLEEKIKSLETSTTRSEVIQALADVFEAAGSKTLLVRTKYKYRIITAINEKRVMLANEWDQALGYASGELKRRTDPYRTVDLSSYLKIAPIVGGVGYLGAIFVQSALPELFVFAYPLAVFIFAAPIAFIIITG